MTLALYVAVLLCGYLIGALPFSFWIGRRRGVDVRAVGSGNVGATNVMRSAGWHAGALAFVLDLLKGVAVSLVAEKLQPGGWLAPASAALAVTGHIFPIWLGFRGGKGVATGLGALTPLAPVAAAGAVTLFAVVFATTRYVSLGSVLAAITLALLAPVLGARTAVTVGTAIIATLIVVRHHPNLLRLRQGTESRMGAAGNESREDQPR